MDLMNLLEELKESLWDPEPPYAYLQGLEDQDLNTSDSKRQTPTRPRSRTNTDEAKIKLKLKLRKAVK